MTSWSLIGHISHAQTFAQGRGIRELDRLVETDGDRAPDGRTIACSVGVIIEPVQEKEK